MASQPDWSALLALAVAAAKDCGTILAERRQQWLISDALTAHDIKLAADRQAEAMILERLAPSGIAVLAEESGSSAGSQESDLCWVVDPLDGTFNYSRGLPICCVSIALLQGGEPILGVIQDFNRDETFSGIVGQGAWLNGQSMAVSQASTPARAILATGLPARRDFADQAMADFGRTLGQWQKVRMLGSAALSMAYTAAGRVDAYWEQAIMPWDIAAGAALVLAAGGTIRRKGALDGQPLDIAAANPTLLATAFPETAP